MRRLWPYVLTLCFVALGFFVTETSFAQSVLLNSSDVMPAKADVYNPSRFWFMVGAGAGYMSSSEHMRTEGVPTQIQILGSYYFQWAPWVMDVGLGLHNQWVTQSGGGSDLISATNLTINPRFLMRDRWQVGPVWDTMMGDAKRFHSNTDGSTSFVGVALMKEIPWHGSYLIRVGGRFMTDVGISGQQVNVAMFDAQIGFGGDANGPQATAQTDDIPVPQIPVPAAAPVATQPVASHLDDQAMKHFDLSIQPLHFQSNSTKITAASETYLKRLAQALADNRDLFETVDVIGHADQRGSVPINNRVSLERAQHVEKILIKAGVQSKQIRVMGLGKYELVSKSDSPQSMGKNRRVEMIFHGVNNPGALSRLLHSID